MPSEELHAAYRAELERRLSSATAPRVVIEARLRRLDEQLARLRQLYEYGEYDWETFLSKRADIQHEQQRLREEATASHGSGDLEWCRTQLLDLVATWDAADEGHRTRLLSALFESLEAEALPQRGLRIVAVPRAAWRGFFQLLALERETGVSRGSANAFTETTFAYRFAS